MVIAVILLSLFALCVIAAALVDLVPTAREWVDRIGIGFGTTEQVRAVAVGWLKKTPAVPISDQTRFTLPERLRGTYKSKNIQAWQQGALLLGIGDCAEGKAFAASLLQNGNWKTPVQRADFALLAYAVLRVSDSEAVRPAMDQMYAFLKEQAGEGTVPYNPGLRNVRFVDTVGMVCPFLWLYAQTYHCPEAQALCMRQLSEYAEKGMHPTLHLPVHSLNVQNGAPLGIYGWGRGCGWYALALAELMCCGADVTAYALPFAESLLHVQQANGAWSRQVLAEQGGESSATAMLGFFMAVLSDTVQDEKYRRAAQKAQVFLQTCIRKNGKVDYAQGDTKGIGFYSKRLSTMPAAQGFVLLLTEALQ